LARQRKELQEFFFGEVFEFIHIDKIKKDNTTVRGFKGSKEGNGDYNIFFIFI
jgi:hypothetical protein